jgi:hypothetical protein
VYVFKRLATHPENWWQPNTGFGTQVTYKPTAKTTLNWSTMLGMNNQIMTKMALFQ